MAAKKRRKGLLPQTKALRYLQEHNWIADPVERKMGLLSKDWGGFADILAVRPETSEAMLIQVTSDTNFASRVKKCLENDEAMRIAAAMPLIQIQVWGYRSGSAKKEGSLHYTPYRVQKLVIGSFRRHRLTSQAPSTPDG